MPAAEAASALVAFLKAHLQPAPWEAARGASSAPARMADVLPLRGSR